MNCLTRNDFEERDLERASKCVTRRDWVRFYLENGAKFDIAESLADEKMREIIDTRERKII